MLTPLLIGKQDAYPTLVIGDCRQGTSLYRNLGATVVKRGIGSLDYLDYLQTVVAVGRGPFSFDNAVDKTLAFGLQRLHVNQPGAICVAETIAISKLADGIAVR